MKPKGPLVTLVAGAAVAAGLLVLDLHATGTRRAGDPAAEVVAATSAAPAAQSASPAPPPAPPPPPSPSPVPPSPSPSGPPLTYTGYTTGGAATIAIAVNSGQAIAYLCDGKRVESWLQGTATGGQLTLTGSHQGSLTGRYDGNAATGTVAAGGRSWTFTAGVVTAPSGLYRSSAEVRGATVVGGWIVLADGTEVGLLDKDDVPGTAPWLDATTGTAPLGDTTLHATRVDGSTRL